MGHKNTPPEITGEGYTTVRLRLAVLLGKRHLGSVEPCKRVTYCNLNGVVITLLASVLRRDTNVQRLTVVEVFLHVKHSGSKFFSRGEVRIKRLCILEHVERFILVFTRLDGVDRGSQVEHCGGVGIDGVSENHSSFLVVGFPWYDFKSTG